MPNVRLYCCVFLCIVLKVTNCENYNLLAQPPNQRNLVILFDATSSTSDDFQQRQRIAQSIVDRFSPNSFVNYMFLPFHQNGIDLMHVVVTPDKYKLIRSLNNLRILDANNCSTNILDILIVALQNTPQNSHIYMFADIIVNNFQRIDNVISLIQQKRASVCCILRHPNEYFLLEFKFLLSADTFACRQL